MKHLITILPGLLTVVLGACSDEQAAQSAIDSARLEQVAQVVARKQDRVSADELARWLIERRADFVLVDIRDDDAYAAGHIDGALHLPVTELVTQEGLRQLPAGRRVIVYSNGSEFAGQAAVLLRLAGRDADLLLGGYNFWSRHVQNPEVPPTAADGEYPQLALKRAIACYFAGGGAPPPVAAPAPLRHRQPPAFTPPTAPPPPPAPEEGC